MNKVYKHIWSKTQGRLVVVSECARGAQGRKSGRRKLTVSLIASSLLSGVAWANDLPSGGQIVSGAGSIASNGNSMTINQSSDRMIANWQSFSIGENNAVTFNQPGASSVALNRVVGQDPSQILGSLNANGQVFLLNPNGIAIGSTGSVQTGGFVASTLGMTDEDFLAGQYQFNGNGGTISNQGDINGSVVALIAPSVTNEGTITAGASSDSATGVALAAGTDVLLDFDGDGLLSVEVKANTLAGLVENNGLIQADGGVAILTAKGASDALKGVVNNTGTVQANSIANKDGRILLLGDMREGQGEVNVAGNLSADFVETSAATVNIDKDLQVDTQGGEWLIDPVNIEIDTAKASAIQTALGSGDVTVTTANGAGWAGETNGTGTDEGNITVNAAIDWAANTLTLRADNDITINAELTSTGTTASDGLVLQYAQTTDTGDYTINAPVNLAAGSLFQTQHASDAAITYTVITDLGVAGSTSATDLQGVNGGLAGNYVLGANIDASDTAGWNAGAGFDPLGDGSTQFSGNFDGLGHVISDLTINRPTESFVGLFGYTNGATIRNIGLEGGSVTGNARVGGLAGRNYTNSTISNAYTTGRVTGAGWYIGGLVGDNLISSTVSNAYATGSVSGISNVGGLVGRNYTDSTISNAYATGSVSGSSNVGGLVGQNRSSTVSNAYATGSVTGDVRAGGLVGDVIFSTIINGYWNTETSGQTSSAGGTGLTTAQMLNFANFSGFDSSIWGIKEGQTSAYLLGFDRHSVLLADGQAYLSVSDVDELQAINDDLGSNYVLWNDIDASGTATWNAGAGFDPLGDAGSKFTGNFDGLGHTISNLTISRSGEDYVGLFGYANGATIQNVGLVGADVTGADYVGGLVGVNTSSTTISNVYATGSVSGSSNVGGLVGWNTSSSTIINAYATGNVSGSSKVGGLVGLNLSSNISQSYATGTVTGTSNDVGGLVGINAVSANISNAYAMGNVSGSSNVGGLAGVNSAAATISNAYATGSVSGSSDVGGLVGENASSTISGSFWNTETSNQSTGIGTDNNSQSATGLTTAEMLSFVNYSGFDSSIWGIHEGETSAYLLALDRHSVLLSDGEAYLSVSTLDELQAINDDLSSNYVLWDDIDASDTVTWNAGAGFDPLGDNSTSFTGSFDGFGHTVSDLTINRSTTNYVGLFGSVGSGGVVQNIGIVGGSISGGSFVGGLVGYNLGSITDAYATGAVVGESHYVGGLVGRSAGTINNAYATGTVVGGGDLVGGLVGVNEGTIDNAYATGTVDGGDAVGGLVGVNEGTIDNAHATGTVDGEDYVGGLVGLNAGTIDNAYATGTVDGRVSVGGLVGLNQGTLSNVYASGEVSGVSDVGGLVGTSGGAISYAYATGNVTGSDNGGFSFIGGLVGFSSDAISYAYATGNVTGSGAYSGGLVGYGETISNAYATGSVTGSDFVGGLAGYTDGAISYAYATGNVTGSGTDIGGLVGDSDGSITDSFWNTETSGQATSAGGTGLTTLEMQDPFTFIDAGWDFVSVWGKSSLDENSGYMMLRGLTAGALYDDYIQLSGNVSKTYGDDNPSLSGITLHGLGTGNITLTWNAGITNTTDVGTYAYADGDVIDVSTSSAGGVYSDYGADGLTVDKAALTLTASDQSKTYGDTFSFAGDEFTSTGLRNGETVGSLMLTSAATSTTANAGSHAITAASATGGTFDIGNYDVTYNTGSFTVDKAALTVTANDASKIYDGLAFTGGNGVTYSGFVNSETDSVLGGTLAYGGTAQSAVNAGTYTLTASGQTSDNYSITYTGGTLAVDKATLSVTANDANKTYDGLAFTGGNGVSYAGFVTGEDESILGGTLAYGGDAQDAVNAGSYTLSASGLTADNYEIAYTDGALAVDKAALTLTANDQSKTYGDAFSFAGTEFASVGLQNGETVGSVMLTSAATSTTANAGSHAITAASATGGTFDIGNYEVTYNTGSFTVDKAALTVTANDASKIYDGLAFTGGNGVSYAGFVAGEDDSVLGGALTYGGTAQSAVNAGTYTLTASGQTSDNYSITYTDGTLAVDKAALSVTANNANKTYDGLAFSGGNGVSYAGFIAGEDDSVLGGSLTYGGTAQSAINAGTYTLTASGQTSDNYSITYTDGTLAVDKAALSVTANDANKTYDGLAFNGGNGVSYAGFVTGEDESILGGTLAYGGDAQDAVNAGIYTLSASGLSADNYEIAYTDGTLAVDKAALTLTANDQSKTYGDAFSFAGTEFASAGLQNGETVGSVTLISAATSITANAGSHAITAASATGGTFDIGNYDVTYNTGSFTVDKAALTVTANDASKIYDGLAFTGGNGVTYSGFVNSEADSVLGGALTYGGTAQAAVNAGAYTLTASGQTSDNYSITYTDGTLTVDKAALSVTANDANKTYDGLAFTGGNGVSYAGFVTGEDESILSGTLAYGGTAQNAVNAGDYTLTASGLTSGNYDFNYVDGMLTVSKAVISAITGLTASDKVYDGSSAATLDTSAVDFSGLISGDSLTLASAAGAFTDKNAGTGKTVNITGLSLGGADVGNYTLASTMTSTTADIAKAAISVITGIIANGKIYDGTTFAALNTSGAGFTGMVEGDALTIAGGKGTFGDADPGFDKSVAITGLSLGGSDAANYVLADTTAEASATIFAPSTATYLLPEQTKRTSLAEFDGRTETLLDPGPELIEVQATSNNQNGG